MTTSAPSWAKRSAIARPIPRLLPVTRAIFPASLILTSIHGCVRPAPRLVFRHSRPHPGNIQPDPVHTGLGGQIQRSAVVIAPRHIVGMLWAGERAQVLAVRRNDPQPAGTRDIEVPVLID